MTRPAITRSSPPDVDSFAPDSPAYARYVLGVLFLVGVFALVDRQIFGMLIEPIKQEFQSRIPGSASPRGSPSRSSTPPPASRSRALPTAAVGADILAPGLGALERADARLGLRDELRPARDRPAWIGVGEAAGNPDGPCAHRRLLPARAARPRPLRLLGRRERRRDPRLSGRRLDPGALGLAGCVPRARCAGRRPRLPRPLDAARAAAGPIRDEGGAPLSTREALRRLLAQPAYRFVARLLRAAFYGPQRRRDVEPRLSRPRPRHGAAARSERSSPSAAPRSRRSA